jgi:GNAT superfamily N-acetyltransferase
MSATGIEIVRVRDEADAEEVRALARALRAWNYEFMPDLTSVIDAYFTSHDFEGHLERLLTVCNPPDGECLLARLDGAAVGAVTLQRRTATEAEVNRLFVRAAARGAGVGRALVTTLIERARGLGYRSVFLSAVRRFDAAIALYRSLGFVEVAEGGDPDDVQIDMRLELP